MIAIKNLVKSYAGHQVLGGISLEQEKGKVVVLIGPSGCGKTTLLRCINQTEQFDSGSMRICGISIVAHKGRLNPADHHKQRKLRSHIGMVFQNFNLFPHMTALENLIAAPMTVKGLERAHAVTQARVLLEKVGLENKADAYPSQLSGGQQQRTAIARALAMEPDVMLFDEPTSALDPELKEDVLGVMRQLAREGMTMLIATHEINFAMEVADRVVFLEAGQIVEAGPAKLICTNPRHARTREFLRKILPKAARKAGIRADDKKQYKMEGIWQALEPPG